MNLRQLIDQLRVDTLDRAAQHMWSDDEIIGYANEAVYEACRRALLLVDSSSSASEASLGIGESEIELHESVIEESAVWLRRCRSQRARTMHDPERKRAPRGCVRPWLLRDSRSAS